jgi:hypothetical protein
MVTDRKKDSEKLPIKQDPQTASPEPNKINASTPYDAATESGVFRYDGQRFQRFGSGEGLPNEVILSLGEAPDGALLAGIPRRVVSTQSGLED